MDSANKIQPPPNVDVNRLRVGARCVEGMHATGATKLMFRHVGVEGIGGQGVLSRQELKLIRWYDEMNEALHMTDGAITKDGIVLFNPHLKLYSAAMTASFIQDQFLMNGFSF